MISILAVEVDPTLTPELNPVFGIVFLVGAAILLVAEIIGVQRRGKGDTITEHWRAGDQWLRRHASWGRWAFRIATAGILVWALLHFLAGSD